MAKDERLHIEDESPPFAIAVRQMRFMSCQLFVEERQGPAEVAVDADVGVDDFIDFYFIDIEVDDLRVRREIFDVASDAVIESGADGDQEVAFRNGHIGAYEPCMPTMPGERHTYRGRSPCP